MHSHSHSPFSEVNAFTNAIHWMVNAFNECIPHSWIVHRSASSVFCTWNFSYVLWSMTNFRHTKISRAIGSKSLNERKENSKGSYFMFFMTFYSFFEQNWIFGPKWGLSNKIIAPWTSCKVVTKVASVCLLPIGIF